MSPGRRADGLLGAMGARPAIPQIYGGLAIGVVATSFAAILIRLAEAPPLVIGAYRLGLASLILTPLAWQHGRTELGSLSRSDRTLLILSGAFLGIHFAAWITSLDYTSVASSVVLVSTNPLFVGLASHFFLGERVGRAMWIGIALSVVGGIVIGFGDSDGSGRALIGDLLALVGALAGSAYFLIGRRVRQRLSLLTYVYPVYWVAAIVLLASAGIAGNSLRGYAPTTYLMFLLLALVPQIVGHSMLNWTLGHLPPTVVSVSILAEPVSSSILAALLLGETPTGIKLVGGILVLVGIYVSLQSRKRRQAGSAP